MVVRLDRSRQKRFYGAAISKTRKDILVGDEGRAVLGGREVRGCLPGINQCVGSCTVTGLTWGTDMHTIPEPLIVCQMQTHSHFTSSTFSLFIIFRAREIDHGLKQQGAQCDKVPMVHFLSAEHVPGFQLGQCAIL